MTPLTSHDGERIVLEAVESGRLEAELAHLEDAWKGPIAEVPLEPIDAGPTLVGVVGEHLAAALEEQ